MDSPDSHTDQNYSTNFPSQVFKQEISKNSAQEISNNSNNNFNLSKVIILGCFILFIVLVLYGVYIIFMQSNFSKQKIPLKNKEIAIVLPKNYKLVKNENELLIYSSGKISGVVVTLIPTESDLGRFQGDGCISDEATLYAQVFNKSLNRNIAICNQIYAEKRLSMYNSANYKDSEYLYYLTVIVSAKTQLDDALKAQLKEIFEEFAVK